MYLCCRCTGAHLQVLQFSTCHVLYIDATYTWTLLPTHSYRPIANVVCVNYGASVLFIDNQFRDDNAALVDQAADVMDVLDKSKDVEGW